jgi:hypothetical protein
LVVSLGLENVKVWDEAGEERGKETLDGEVLDLEREVGELGVLEVVEEEEGERGVDGLVVVELGVGLTDDFRVI